MNNVYKDEILDHYKYPRNEGELELPDIEVNEGNASCGDSIRLQLKLSQDEKVEEVRYLCHGCVISKAASSMLTEAIKGRRIVDLKKLSLEDIYHLLGGPVSMGRVACAGLGLKALHKAIQAYQNTKSTKE